MNITTREAINRGNNLLIVGFLAVTGAGMIAVIFHEDEILDRLDEYGILLAAIASVIWYLWGRNRYTRSFIPVVLLVLAFLSQIAGFFFESDDAAAVGDNIGLAIPLILMLVIAGVTLYRTREIARPTTPDV